MITEDFVSFETAKLLKEKGFNEKCGAMYDKDGYFVPFNFKLLTKADKRQFVANAPTLQMAMKWLREVHHIDIEVRTHYLNHLKRNDIRYYSGKILKDSEDVIQTIYSKDTYEEVCETAIRYCLENLI